MQLQILQICIGFTLHLLNGMKNPSGSMCGHPKSRKYCTHSVPYPQFTKMSRCGNRQAKIHKNGNLYTHTQLCRWFTVPMANCHFNGQNHPWTPMAVIGLGEGSNPRPAARHLERSVPMLLSLSLCGLSLAGADVAGFMGDPDVELFVRWHQLGIWRRDRTGGRPTEAPTKQQPSSGW